MKKFLIATALLYIVTNSISQTCEQRESKLLEALGGFSAGMLYNTYGLIGSISDGFTHDAYDAVTLSELMLAQIKVIDNLAKMVEELIARGYLIDVKDLNYANSLIDILKGLKKQAQLLETYADKKNNKNQTAYDEQRKQNWSAISKLMGIEE